MQGDRVSFQGFARRAGVLAIAALTLVACAETQLAVHTAKRVGGTADVSPGTGSYKVGSPYQIDGRWYYPKEDYTYVEEGIASWYGPNFHGKTTANGEVYDMNDLTAAHRTLPMPSVVRVTNLENGRALVLRVNDRGPFAKDRIIDVSRRSAQLLGFEGQGTARVRVEILPEESIALRDALRDGRGGGVVTASASTPASTPRVTVQLPVSSAGGTSTSVTADAAGGVSAQARATVPGAGSATLLVPPPSDAPSSRVEVTQTTVSAAPVKPVASVVPSPAIPTSTSGGIYIQAGAFASLGNARRLEADLRDFAPTVVTQVDSGNATLYRVRLGPLSGEADARRLLDRLASAGYGNVMVVAD